MNTAPLVEILALTNFRPSTSRRLSPCTPCGATRSRRAGKSFHASLTKDGLVSEESNASFEEAFALEATMPNYMASF